MISFVYSFGFVFYIFARSGAEELVRLQPMIRMQPASFNTPNVWKGLAILAVPIQALSFFLFYYVSSGIFPTLQ